MRLQQWKANGWLQTHTAGTVGQSDAVELHTFAHELRADVIK